MSGNQKVLNGVFRTMVICFSLIFSTICISQTWTLIGPPIVDVSPIHMVADESSLYLGSWSNFTGQSRGSIFKLSEDSSGYDTLITGIDVHAIIAHPNHPETIFAGLYTNYNSEPGIIKSIDGGETWCHIDSGIYLSSQSGVTNLSIHPTCPDTMFASVGGNMSVKLYRTYNGGEFWQVLENEGHSLFANGIAYHPQFNNVVFIATITGIYKTSDCGDTWVQIFEETNGWGCNDIAFIDVDTSNLYASCSYSGVYKCTNDVYDWEYLDLGIGDIATGKIDMSTQRSGEVFVRAGGGIYRSTNFGDDWTDYAGNLTGVQLKRHHYFANGDKVYIATELGIYKTNLPPITSAIAWQTNTDEESVHIYPNPFNSSLTIEVLGEDARYNNVTIYNIKGEIIRSLEIKQQGKGEYYFSWDGISNENESITSGIYIISLVGPVHRINSKVTLIR